MLILWGLQAGWPEVGCRRPAIASTIIIMIFINIIIISIIIRVISFSIIDIIFHPRYPCIEVHDRVTLPLLCQGLCVSLSHSTHPDCTIAKLKGKRIRSLKRQLSERTAIYHSSYAANFIELHVEPGFKDQSPHDAVRDEAAISLSN